LGKNERAKEEEERFLVVVVVVVLCAVRECGLQRNETHPNTKID
jgi:hypothetical protein